ncbi:MAG TPA: DUF2341 domain-containing protein, partial [Bacteroidales bacterium]|nr:DUF2341 domain-containing protein [Bacteroidales bacterium]
MRITNRNIFQWSGKFTEAIVAGVILIFLYHQPAEAQVPFSSLGYAYEKTITIDAGEVAGPDDLVDYPILVNISVDAELRTIVNGGNIYNNNGYDIAFIDEDGYKLDHEIERYEATTGQLIAWVRIPVLSTSANTVLKILYGNPQINTSDPSAADVWNSDFTGVWHLNDQNNIADAAGGDNIGTNNGTVDINGLIGFAQDFEASQMDYIDISNESSFDIITNITVSAWVKRESYSTQWQAIITKGDNSWRLHRNSSTNAACLHLTGGSNANGTINVNNGNWHYIVGTYDGTNSKLFIDGVLDASGTGGGNISLGNYNVAIGENLQATGRYFDGIIDEARVLSATRSLEWIQTEYNNQRIGSTFYIISVQAPHSTYDFEDVCQNSLVTYSIPELWTTYTWNLTGGTIQSGGGTREVEVLWTSAIGTGTISVDVYDGSFTGIGKVYNVGVNVAPTAGITPDPAQTCPGIDLGLNGNPSGGSGIYTGHVWSGAGSGSLYATDIVNPDFNNASCGSYGLTYTVTDDNGCVGSDNITVEVNDNTAPAWTTAAGNLDRTVECSDAAALTTAQALVPAATDNCDATLTPVKISGLFAAGGCAQEGSYTNTWTVTDDCGNVSAVYTQVITVTDNTAPTFTQPADITIYKDASCAYDASVGVTGDVADEADNCDTSLDATFGDAVVNGACEGEQIITRTWSLTDDCGNNTQHVQVITVEDNIAPTFTAPADITIYKDASCAYDASVGVTGDVTDEADNCDTSLDATFSDAVAAGGCEGEQIITRTWTLTDDCGNNTQHVQVITVEDNIAPTFTQPADITIYKNASCTYDASVGVTGDVADEADNCDTSLDATFSDAVADGACEGEQI